MTYLLKNHFPQICCKNYFGTSTTLWENDRFSEEGNSYQSCLHHYWEMIHFQGMATLIKVAHIIMGNSQIFKGKQLYQSCLHHYQELIDFQGKAILSKLPTSLWGNDRFSGEGNSIKVAYIIMGKSGDGNSIKVAYINMGK